MRASAEDAGRGDKEGGERLKVLVEISPQLLTTLLHEARSEIVQPHAVGQESHSSEEKSCVILGQIEPIQPPLEENLTARHIRGWIKRGVYKRLDSILKRTDAVYWKLTRLSPWIVFYGLIIRGFIWGTDISLIIFEAMLLNHLARRCH